MAINFVNSIFIVSFIFINSTFVDSTLFVSYTFIIIIVLHFIISLANLIYNIL